MTSAEIISSQDPAEKITTDHATIRKWAQSHRAKPELINMPSSQADNLGLRLNFPGEEDEAFLSDAQATPEISWDQFFQEFEAQQLAFIYYEPHDPALPIVDAYRFIKRSAL